MTFTTYDGQTARRAAVTAVLAIVVAWFVATFTDEGGVAWSARIARVLPLSPGCAALGTWASLARGRARGEAMALAALGRSPWQSSAAAVMGGAVLGLVSALLVAMVAAVDVHVFFPAIPQNSAYHFDGSVFVDELGRFSVSADGAIKMLGPRVSASPLASLPARARAVAALTTAVATVAFCPLAARVVERTIIRTGMMFGATLLTSVILFHAAAAGLVPAAVCPAPSILLLAVAASSYRAKAWQWTRR